MAKIVDLKGQRFGSLVVLRRDGEHRPVRWITRCDCGKKKSIVGDSLRRGLSTSCGCNRLVDMTGMKVGRLTVLRRNGKSSWDGQLMWLCRCECGSTTTVIGQSLRNGSTKSCGCFRVEHCRKVGQERRLQDFVQYSAVHQRMKAEYGPASQYECVDCGDWAKEWSLRHDAMETHLGQNGKYILRYSLDTEDYEPRCKQCHIAYDREWAPVYQPVTWKRLRKAAGAPLRRRNGRSGVRTGVAA